MKKNAAVLYEASKKDGLLNTLSREFGSNIRVSVPFSTEACDTSIDELNFSVRAMNSLKRNQCMTVGKLIQDIEEERLLQFRNLGRKTYIEIKTGILVYGYSLLTEREKLAFWNYVCEAQTGKQA